MSPGDRCADREGAETSRKTEPYRRWPSPTPRMPARRRRAPTVRFITFDTLVTGVRAFECAFSVRTSSFVHGLTTRRDDLAGFAVLANFEFLAVFFRALGIIQVLQLNAVHIGMRCGDSKAVVNVGTCGTIHAHVQRTTTYSHGCEENLKRGIRRRNCGRSAHAGRSFAIQVESPFRA